MSKPGIEIPILSLLGFYLGKNEFERNFIIRKF